MAKSRSLTKADPVKVLTGVLTCGECAGLTRERLIVGSKASCTTDGILASHKACPKFKPDVYRLAEVVVEKGNVMQELAYISSSMTPKQLKIFGMAMINETITRKNGFSFYQKVFVRYRGTARSNYLSNFFAGRILTADETTVRVCSDDGKVIFTYENTGAAGPSIYSVESFEPLRALMFKKSYVVDPEHERATAKFLRAKELSEHGDIKLNTNGVHGIVTPEKVSRSNKNAGKKGARSEIHDLTSIARDIERGSVSASRKDGTVVLSQNKYRGRTSSGEHELSDL